MYELYLFCFHDQRFFRLLLSGLSNDGQDGDLNADSVLKKAKWLFGTGLVTVEEMREKRCAWTLRGWKDKDKDGKEIMRAEEVHVEDSVPSDKNISEDKKQSEAEETKGEEEKSGDKEDDGDGDEKESGNSQGNEQSLIDSEMSLVCKTSWEGKGRQAVRDVYNRACLVHCQRKAMIRLRWAAFEEDSGDHEKAKEILMRLRDAYPLLLECRIQIIDIERRLGNLDRAEEEYKSLIKKVPKNRNSIRTWLSIKLARFQFKVKGQADKALATLRAALKKEKGMNGNTEHFVYDLCILKLILRRGSSPLRTNH